MAGSTPYFQFGAQRRYPYAWHGGAGGVPQSRLASESRELGIFDMLESNPPGAMAYSALRQTHLHNPTVIGDWPLVRPAGLEPLDPHEGTLAGILDLSNNEKTLALFALAAAGAWWFMKRKRLPTRNPARRDGRWPRRRRR